MTYRPNDRSKLAHRLLRRPNIGPTLGRHVVLAGKAVLQTPLAQPMIG